jgi:hypothetical protein
VKGVLLLCALAALSSGCKGTDRTGAPVVPSDIVGTVGTIVEDGGSVVAFRVDTGTETYTIRIKPGRDYGFDLQHLHDHQRQGDPVRVLSEPGDQGPYAVRIDDVQ